MERDARQSCAADGGLEDLLAPGAEERTAGRGGEDQAVARGFDVLFKVLLDPTHHPARHGDGPLLARGLRFAVKGDVTPQLDRSPGDSDTRAQGIDVLAP